jgi:hypothetical protein
MPMYSDEQFKQMMAAMLAQGDIGAGEAELMRQYQLGQELRRGATATQGTRPGKNQYLAAGLEGIASGMNAYQTGKSSQALSDKRMANMRALLGQQQQPGAQYFRSPNEENLNLSGYGPAF